MNSDTSQGNSLRSHVQGLVLLEEIGSGSYGNVYHARWKGKDVAAKRFHSILFQNGFSHQQYMRDFQREREVLETLDHPNVVKLKTVLLPKGHSPIIITELLHCDLEKYIRVSTTSPKVPEMNLIQIATDVIEGLEYMHGLQSPIVHRDLATKNILLTINGNAKIADFGVSKVFSAGCDMYATQVPGTLVYAAPETYPAMRQFQVIEGPKYGPKVDVFSFGAVLLCMIVGHEPLVWPMTPLTKDGQMISEHERRKHDIDEMGEHSLKQLVFDCLQNDSQLRPDVKDIKDELKGYKWRVVRQHNDCEPDETVIELVNTRPVYDYKFKVLLIGDRGVGKSCLFNRFRNPAYNVYMSTTTVGVEIDRPSFRYGSKFVRLEVADTAGQEHLFAIQRMYFRGVHGIFLVFDVTNRESFHDILKWLEIAQQYCTENSVSIILIGNKIDQVHKRQVSVEEGHAIAGVHNLSFMEASALNVESIEKMFKTMIQLLVKAVDLSSIKIELKDRNDKVKLEELPKKSTCNKCKKQ
ncbi:uncharacterized protein [Montipora foliosa]|uniref:uncharacterized protein n=1 Tax=Montipora foliosa TaxID=591990 RepID=UPI0035F1415F